MVSYRTTHLIGLQLSPDAPDYNLVLYTSEFACVVVYGKPQGHEAVLYRTSDDTASGIIEAVFVHRETNTSTHNVFVLRRLIEEGPDVGNLSVVQEFGDTCIFV